jgi:hypothetical protein
MGQGVALRPPDLQNLADKLSQPARRQLAEALKAHRAMQLVGEWVRQALGIAAGPPRGGGDFRRFFPREEGDRPPPPPPPDDDSDRGRRPPPAQPRQPADNPPLSELPKP